MSKKRPLSDENNSEVANLATEPNFQTPIKPIEPKSPSSVASSTTLEASVVPQSWKMQ